MSALSLLTIALALSAVHTGDAPLPTDTWPTAAPEEKGFDAERLDALVERIESGRIANIHSLLIVRNGWLVLEEYFGGTDPDAVHMMQSVSKSVTSALVGIAIEKGEIEGVGERVLDFFPELVDIDHLDERKRAMTLEDLLTMRSGSDYHERGSSSPHAQLNRMQSGWTEFILGRPMKSEPGTTFQYDSGAVILISAVLQERAGLHGDAYAREHLFAPLGIETSEWYCNSEGHAHMGGGLDLRSRDLAKFGLLYLRGGRWGDAQVVPADWVETSLSRHVTFDRPHGDSVGYGYWWWVFPPDPDGSGDVDIYAACGFRGQYVFLVPEHDLMVVVTAGGRGWAEERAPRDFLYDDILPALQR